MIILSRNIIRKYIDLNKAINLVNIISKESSRIKKTNIIKEFINEEINDIKNVIL